MKLLLKPLLLTLAVLLAGCASTVPETAAPVPAESSSWLQSFGSAELDQLVALAQRQSLDSATALARLRQAQASSRIAGADLWPQASASLRASRESGNASAAGSEMAIGFSARYEVDFWGRQRGAQDAALADLRASQFDRDTVRLTLIARVASSWLQVLALREQQALAEQQLSNAQRLLQLVESRSRAGAALPLDLAQQRGLVAAQQRSVAALAQQAADSQTTLAVLLGQPNAELPPLAAAWADVHVPAITPGLPSSLLARRPDIARAEARLAAADARVAVARAAMLPSVSLTADIASDGPRLRRLFDNPLYTLAAGLTAPIFDAGRLSAGHDLAQAQREELLANYRASILAAFGDMAQALNAIAGLDAQLLAQHEALAQARRALQLAESRYRAGADTLLVLLDAQRTLASAQDSLVQLQLARLQAAVSLFQALGG